MAHERPGPLTPEFVLKMLDSSKHYADISKQFDQGRVMPWDLDNESLSNNVVRIEKVVLDPATQQMTYDVVLRGTFTNKDDVVKLTSARPTVDLSADVEMAGTDAIRLEGKYEIALPVLHVFLNEWHENVHHIWERSTTVDMPLHQPKVVPPVVTGGISRADPTRSCNKSWSFLQCRHHPEVQMKAEELAQLREAALELVISRLEEDPDQFSITNLVLTVPGCPECFHRGTHLVDVAE
ncbi:hypothetical protein VPNG_00474 [Cytospora leucostoma]|uniref:Uncharacterized protein n=1 Tax=Cytospora leucostoma TaxID=1230097 RepID=A0A423XNL9_9PEZI|nr:hypothetical protein VPNG_00474 [Cytospora leucostoma]